MDFSRCSSAFMLRHLTKLFSSFQEIISPKSHSSLVTSHPLNTALAYGSNLAPLFTLHILLGGFLLLWHEFKLITLPSSSLTIRSYLHTFLVFPATPFTQPLKLLHWTASHRLRMYFQILPLWLCSCCFLPPQMHCP